MRTVLACLLSLLPLLAQAAPALLVAPAIGTQREVVLRGRVLQSAPKRGSSTLSRNLRRLAADGLEGVRVRAEVFDASTEVVSAQDGAFEARLVPGEGRSFPAGIARARLLVKGAQAATAVEIVPDDAPFVVISDFDDTVAVSNVTDPAKLLGAALLADWDTQPAVERMSDFYRCLRKRTPGFAFVSGSPVQYVPRLASFLGKHQFPFAGLYLRDLSPKTLSGYKQPVLRALLESFPHKVVLIGDAGEKDPEIYKELRAEFPDRVARIYIRKVRPVEDEARFEEILAFRSADEAIQDAIGRGLIDDGCAGIAAGASRPQ